MTRATLLHVLDRPTALGPAEVRELEQLAQAFPYCQTAHLLLAKAAHDQGTMLAGQRLRRAATYAADRTLLRRLIELVEPAPVAETDYQPEALPTVVTAEIPAASAAPVLLEPVEATVPEQVVASVPVAIVAPVPTPVIASSPLLVDTPLIEAVAPAEPAPSTEAALAPIVELAPSAPAAEIVPEAAVPVTADPASTGPEFMPIVGEPMLELPAAEPSPALIPADETQAEPGGIAPSFLPIDAPEAPVSSVVPQVEADKLPALIDQEGASIPALAPTTEAEPETILIPELAAEEADLPAQAPAIRPPVEVGEARFEFGLAEPAPPVTTTYELPGLVDEWAAAAVTLSLGSPEALLSEAIAPPVPAFTPAAFTGDAAVGYSFGESSRLGLSMQLLDLLAAQAEAAEATTAVVAAAQPPAAALPPTGTFFEPDPLLLDHWATHCPPPPALPSSLDLINNFLKRQPRLTRPAMLPPTAGGQADLSARSTRAEPDLVSENLARIFVRQGKITRAIEIYEKLMVKHPEKMAYFAAQIQSLQQNNASI